MKRMAHLFTALLLGMIALLYGPKAQANLPGVSLPDGLVFSPTTIPNGSYGSAYTAQTLTVTGGTAPYTFLVTAGNLAPGMSLSTDGTLSGTPTAAGTYSFTVTAQDATPSPGTVSGTQDYTLVISPAALTITANPAGSVYGAALVAAGSLTVTYNGFVNGDNATKLTTAPTVSNTAVAGSAAGSYTLTPGGAASSNYTFTYVNGTYTISKAVLTATADNKTMPLGGPLPAFTVSYSGFVNGDDATSVTTPSTATTTALATSPAGSYMITPAGGAAANYTFIYANGTLTVTKAVLTITANPAGSVYGAALVANGSLTVSYSGFVNGDDATKLTTLPTVSNAAVAGSAAGSYTLTPGGAASSNYTFNYVNGTYTISQAALSITAVNKTMTYGGAVPALTASYSGFVNGDDATKLSTPPTLGTAVTSASAAGSYPITVSGAVDPNYAITYTNGTLTVNKAVLTATADNKTMPLGGPLPTFTVSYSGFVNGDDATSVTTPSTATTAALATSPAGSYMITPAGGAAANYTFIYANGTLTVTKAVLTITANPAGSVYGAALVANGSLTVSYSGFVNGDDATKLTTAPTVSNAAVAGSPAGSYTLTPSGAASSNYTFNYVNGTYTISQAALSITAVNKTMTYGGAVPALTASYSGFVNGDDATKLSTPPTLGTAVTSASAAGSYPITVSGAVDANYSITYTNGTLTVNKAVLTVTADNKTMPLGGPLPALTVSYSGFVNGDNATSLGTPPTATTTALATSPAGSYTITPGGGVAANYTFSYVNGILSVGKAVLTITANPAGSVYGAALVPNGSLTVSYSGFVNGDDATKLTTQPTIANAAVAGSPAGNYALVASGASSPNYTINYVNGTYTISPAALAITAVNQTMTYGGAVPALTASYSGFVNGDNATKLTTAPALATTATSASAAGSYPITVSGAASPNYTITYTNGTLTVNKATLTLTADNKNMTLGGPLPVLTISYSGFVNGDNAASLSTQPTVTTTATATSPAGSYPITVAGGTSPNYTLNYVNGTLTVGKAVLTITANPAGSVYGAALVPNSSLTVSYSGFVNGDGPASLTTQPTIANAAFTGAPAGNYALVASGASSPNYTINYVNGTYTISRAALNITATNQTMTYGGTVPTLAVTYSGLVNGDNPGNLATKATITTTATSSSPAGIYPITVSGAADPNYTITFTSGVLTINKATLTITADSKSMPLGGPLPALTISYSGFVNGDNAASLTTQPVLTVPASANSPAGVYQITPSGAASPNYTFNYVTGILSVGKAVLTITANPASSVYGAALVAAGSLTVSYSGFVNGDGPGNLTALPTVTNTAIAGAPVGSYALIPSGAQSDNYAINYVNGTYKITPAPLTITAVTQTMPYGGPVPPLTATYNGFVNGDNTSRLTTQPTLATNASLTSPVGAYAITVSGAVDPNYTITYSPGILIVQKATLTVTPNPASMTYGGTVPALTASYSGFVNGDNASTLTTAPVLTTTATPASPVGSYPITASGAVGVNYSIVYNPGTLTVNPATLHVTANAQTKQYGTPDPVLTYTTRGLVNGDNSGVFTGSLSRTPGESVGTYAINQGTLSAGSNYTIDFTSNKLTITEAVNQITWNQSLVVGCNSQTQITLTATASSGLPVTYSVADPNIASVSGNVLTLLQPGSTVITATQAGDGNYNPAKAVTDTVYYQAASLIRQRWDDVIFFDNSSGNYVEWQWYKDGNAVPGATSPYYSESPSLNGQYYVIATNTDSQRVQSCILDITPGTAAPGGIKVFPNPIAAGTQATITSNYTPTALQGAILQIVDLSGRVRQQITTVEPSMQVKMPSETGTYIINLQLVGGQKASVNVLVIQ